MDAHLPYNENKFTYYFCKEKTSQKIADPSKLSADYLRWVTLRKMLNTSDKDFVRSLYDGQIRYIDSEIKRIIDFLKEINIYKNTVLIITSDHGEEFWEHDNFEHGHSLYEEVIRIPLIIKTDKEEGKRIEYPVSLISIAPTILDLTGIKYRLAPFQGQSLFNSVKRKNSRNDEIFLYGTLYGYEKYGVIKSGKKLIVNTFNPLNKLKFIGLSSSETYELYNLLDDCKCQGLFPLFR